MMGLDRYQRETNVVRMMGAWLATQNSYRDAADELSYQVKNKITHSKIQRMVWSIGNELADVEEAEIKQWDGSVLSNPPIPFFDEKELYYNFGYI
jgi:hypothetical protein